VKRKKSESRAESREKLHLAKETIRHLLSEDLQQVAGGICAGSVGLATLQGCSRQAY